MGPFIKGDVVVVPFPFSNIKGSTRRPALVIKDLSGDDLILCQITASRSDEYSVSLTNKDFKKGGLRKKSVIRPNRMFTADYHLIIYKIGSLKTEKINEVINKIIEIVQS